MASEIRLYVDQPLGAGQSLSLDAKQSNYLFNVMRLEEGAPVSLINGRDGTYQARVARAHRKAGVLVAEAQAEPLTMPPDLWLVFAPVKKARTDFIVEKATELGVRAIQPVITRHSNTERINVERLRAHAIEATEQCGGNFVPELRPPVKFDVLLRDWPSERHALFCDEAEAAPATPLPELSPGPSAIFVGPEGGFAENERAQLQLLPQVQVIGLGPRILRADTAAVAAITLWQAACGDWYQR